MKNLIQFLSGLSDLIYPNLCLACEEPLSSGEKYLCFKCHLSLPKTDFHYERGNKMEKKFIGKINFEAATALYYFTKGSRVQHLVHQIKYKNQQDAAKEVGRIFGKELKNSDIFSSISLITPIPLHINKLISRGYNQSDLIGIGISEILEKPFVPDLILRNHFTQTQTKKRRMERFENVQNIFQINSKYNFEGNHILLIDDVVTTGSTLESCSNEILKIYNSKISIAALAFAN